MSPSVLRSPSSSSRGDLVKLEPEGSLGLSSLNPLFKLRKLKAATPMIWLKTQPEWAELNLAFQIPLLNLMPFATVWHATENIRNLRGAPFRVASRLQTLPCGKTKPPILHTVVASKRQLWQVCAGAEGARWALLVCSRGKQQRPQPGKPWWTRNCFWWSCQGWSVVSHYISVSHLNALKSDEQSLALNPVCTTVRQLKKYFYNCSSWWHFHPPGCSGSEDSVLAGYSPLGRNTRTEARSQSLHFHSLVFAFPSIIWGYISQLTGFSVGTVVKNLPPKQEMWVWSLGQEDLLEQGMATHSSILAWKVPQREEPCGLQSIGSQRVRQDWVTNMFIFTFPN